MGIISVCDGYSKIRWSLESQIAFQRSMISFVLDRIPTFTIKEDIESSAVVDLKIEGGLYFS